MDQSVNQSINQSIMDNKQKMIMYLMELFPLPEDGKIRFCDQFDVEFSGLVLECTCELNFQMEGENYYYIKICSKDIYGDRGLGLDAYVLYRNQKIIKEMEKQDVDEDVEEDINKMEDKYYNEIDGMLEWNKDLLNNLLYDNRQGKLIDKREPEPLRNMLEYDDNRFAYYGNMIKHINNECCVCYEKTMSKTNCHHSICIQCASKIKKDISEGFEDVRKCPMCRNELFIP